MRFIAGRLSKGLLLVFSLSTLGCGKIWSTVNMAPATDHSSPSQNQQTFITATYDETCAVVSGAGYCWGDNTYGQLGNNSTLDSLVISPLVGLSSGVTAISGGFVNACAIVNGGVWCWGDNVGGDLGNSFTTQSNVPTQVVGLSSGVLQITKDCALLSNGSVQCWGDDSYCELGNGLCGGGNSSPLPVQVTGLTTGVTAIASGYGINFALVNGVLQVWGTDGHGNSGTNSLNGIYSATVPVLNWP